MSTTSRPERLYTCLEGVHQRLKTFNVLMGSAALIKWLIVIFLGVFLVDWVISLPAAIRYITLALIVAMPLKMAWQHGWRRCRRFSATENALRIEAQNPEIRSLLVTGIQLHEQGTGSGVSGELTDLTIRHAEEAVSGLKTDGIVPFETMKRPAMMAGILCVALVLFSVVNTPLLKTGLQRVFTPWVVVSYPTRTQIVLSDEPMIVKEGQSVEIKAMLEGEIPKRARLILRTGKGKPSVRTLEVADASCEYGIKAAFRSFDYAIKAGDARTDWQAVTVITAPRVAETRIRLEYPEYMDRAPDVLDAMTLNVPEGAIINWDLTLDRAVSRAGFATEGEETIPLSISPDGMKVSYRMSARASGAYSFSWTEKKHGFDFDTSKHYLQVLPDQSPQVELVTPGRDLFATLDRAITLQYRGGDDHGLGPARVIYSWNNAAEKTVPFQAAEAELQSVQDIDWDYRKALPDVNIGDSVTFAVELEDRYPGEGGAHRIRSKFRRVSFLSKEDYLSKMEEYRDRLLARLQSIYSQERAAHEVIARLDPQDPAFQETCFLEAARQDILVERIAGIDTGISDLIMDLKANNCSEDLEYASLQRLQRSLADISRTYLAESTSRLTDLGTSRDNSLKDVRDASKAVDTAARALSTLVLKLGVREALDVYGRELHVLAQIQSRLQVETISGGKDAEDLAARQAELESWMGELIDNLGDGLDYEDSPLLLVRMLRMLRDTRNQAIREGMNEASTLIASGRNDDASRLQRSIKADLFSLESRVSVGSEYRALLEASKLFSAGLEKLTLTGKQLKAGLISATDAESTLRTLYRDLQLLILPEVPAPTSPLLSKKPAGIPDVEKYVESVLDDVLQASESLATGKTDDSLKEQERALEAFAQLNDIVTVRLAEVRKVVRYAGYSGAAAENLTLIQELFASQMRLTEKVEDADYDQQSAAYLAPAQNHLSKEVQEMQQRLKARNKGESASAMLAPMLKMLGESAEAMVTASGVLKTDDLAGTLEHQDVALNKLQAAKAIAFHEANGWLGVANLIMTAEGTEMPANYMSYVVAEQKDLVADTEQSTPETRKRLVAVQKMLSQAVYSVSELMAGTGSGLDFEQATIFTASDMGQSAQHLEAGNVAGAVNAQKMAVESSEDLHTQLASYARQFHYFVTAMEFLQDMHSKGVVVAETIAEQSLLLEDGDGKSLPPAMKVLSALQPSAETYAGNMFAATGRDVYTNAMKGLSASIDALKGGDQNAALDQLIASENKLKDGLIEQRELMAKIAAIPMIEPIEAPEEYFVMLEMATDVLNLEELIVTVHRSEPSALPGLLSELSEVKSVTDDLIESTGQHKFVVSAGQSLAKAMEIMKPGSREALLEHLYAAEFALHQCILEYALYYVEIPKKGGGKKKKKGKSGEVFMFKMTLDLKPAFEKEYGGEAEEDPENGRSEWEVLGRRDRAALHENFIRELPLEYREFLKDYYQRLTQ